MVAVEDWKNQLYEKTQIAVKYSPAKYKPAYKIMRVSFAYEFTAFY